MDMSQYRDLFLAESREHVGRLNELILCLEQAPGDQEKINALFRAAHSLKGMAASMGYDPIAELAHKMEDLLCRVREGEFSFAEDVASLLLEGADLLATLLDDVAGERPFTRTTSPLIQRLITFLPQETVTGQPSIPFPAETVHADLPHSAPLPPSSRESIQTVRVRTEILDRLIDTTGELFTTKHRLLDAHRQLHGQDIAEGLNDLARLLRELHQMVMKVRLMPFSLLAERFPRLVRELAQKNGKEVALSIDGRDIELDRGILEELADPLVHILRNAVDHGLEPPQERLAAGKPKTGRIRLSAWREKDQVVIAVEDDGRGMDPERLIAVAVGKSLISPDEGMRMTPREAYLLTTLPGFSTACEVTDVSGRGVGMDAVRATIQTLGGDLLIDSELGRGSRISLRLPLTIAIINVLQIVAGHLKVAVPVTSVLRTLELSRDQVMVKERRASFCLDEEEIPLVSLNRLLGVPLSATGLELLPVIVAEIKGRRIGVAVDRVLGQKEVHVKPVGRPLNRLRGISGGAILGDGEIIFILDPATLF